MFCMDLNGKPIDGKSYERPRSSMLYSDPEYNKVVNIANNWNLAYFAKQEAFRRAHKPRGYHIDKRYLTELSEHPDGSSIWILKLKPGELNQSALKHGGTLLARLVQVFEAIHQAHREVGHMKIQATHNNVCKIYCNISEKLVQIFIVEFQFVLMDLN